MVSFHTIVTNGKSYVPDEIRGGSAKLVNVGFQGDEVGHLIACIFDELGEKLNIVPMSGNLNKGAWKQMENTWATALKEVKQVKVKIDPVYSEIGGRPESFNVSYSINGGQSIERTFINAPGGK